LNLESFQKKHVPQPSHTMPFELGKIYKLKLLPSEKQGDSRTLFIKKYLKEEEEVLFQIHSKSFNGV